MAHRTRLVLAFAGALALAGSLLPTSLARADSRGADPVVVASGLDNPRQLSFDSSGALYVAEAGRGGSGPCVQGPEGRVCFGRSGAVTKITLGGQQRVLTGLPSLGGEGGNSATGPADIVVSKGRYLLAYGLGGTPSTRTGLPAAGKRLGTVVGGRLGGSSWVVADLARYEARRDPDGAGADSNPVALSLGGRGIRSGVYAVDAGGNDVLRVSPFGAVRTVATLPMLSATAPDGSPMQTQSVPTSVVRGPDGALYVAELTGFPFPKGGARIWRIAAGQQPKVWATGLTNVTDLAWYRGELYAVQLASDGLLAQQGLPQGSLVKIRKGSTAPRIVAANLNAPYAVAMRWGSAYVTTCSVCAGGGQVVRVSLR